MRVPLLSLTMATVAVRVFLMGAGLSALAPIVASGEVPVVAGGLLVAGYGVLAGLLLLPFGWWSDRVGRAPVVAFGLAVFGIGAGVAALHGPIGEVLGADPWWVLAAGRLLEGAGAATGVAVTAMLDRSSVASHARALSTVTLTTGAAFVAGLVLGPLLWSLGGALLLFGIPAVLGLVIASLWAFGDGAGSVRTMGARHDEATALWRPLWLPVVALFLVQAVFVVGLVVQEHWAELASYQVWRGAAAADTVRLLSVAAPGGALGLAVVWLCRALEVQVRALVLLGAGAGVAAASATVWDTGAASLGWLVRVLLVALYVVGTVVTTAWVAGQVGQAARGTAIGVLQAAGFLGAFVGGQAAAWAVATGRGWLVLTLGILLFVSASLRWSAARHQHAG